MFELIKKGKPNTQYTWFWADYAANHKKQLFLFHFYKAPGGQPLHSHTLTGCPSGCLFLFFDTAAMTLYRKKEPIEKNGKEL